MWARTPGVSYFGLRYFFNRRATADKDRPIVVRDRPLGVKREPSGGRSGTQQAGGLRARGRCQSGSAVKQLPAFERSERVAARTGLASGYVPP